MSIFIASIRNKIFGSFSYSASVVIIGGMSFHRAMIAEYLYEENYDVLLIEDSMNIAPVPMKWDRWSQLTVHKFFVDFSDQAKLKMILSGAITVLYVPTGLIDMEKMTNDPVKAYQLGSLTLAHFQKLLLLISEVYLQLISSYCCLQLIKFRA